MAVREKRSPLQSEIIRFIQNYISENGLTQGDKLPSQEQLIAMMGVSRTSLREAVKTLEAKGILTVLNGKGIYIADNHREALQFTLAAIYLLGIGGTHHHEPIYCFIHHTNVPW